MLQVEAAERPAAVVNYFNTWLTGDVPILSLSLSLFKGFSSHKYPASAAIIAQASPHPELFHPFLLETYLHRNIQLMLSDEQLRWDVGIILVL